MSRKTCISKTAKNAYFGSKSVIFGPKVLIFWKGAKVLVPIFQKTTRSYCFWSGMAPNGPQKPVLGQKCQFFCLGNPIFVNGTFVALCVTTIARIGPIKISLFVSICRAWCSVFFLKIWTLSHCGTLSVKHTGWIKQAKWNIHKAGTSKVLKTYTLQ